MILRKRVLPYLLITVFVLVGVFSISSTSAFAMNSKGDASIAFHTDANTYTKTATTIDVYGICNSKGVSVELYRKGNNKAIKINDVYKGFNYNKVTGGFSYKTSFSLKGLPAGQYDVCVYGSWGWKDYRAELQHYLTVQR
ncbi:hypothetical protein HCA63_08570 [Listeria booriae]|uniref:hypothetical protein n=1 Tax=Listeria booriae TaxID=1552123 RepID=UPI00162321F3|nr:hypothetical protein [Listeria booriae]MBC1888404.1 hypothetical protein [Listeria booriae]